MRRCPFLAAPCASWLLVANVSAQTPAEISASTPPPASTAAGGPVGAYRKPPPLPYGYNPAEYPAWEVRNDCEAEARARGEDPARCAEPAGSVGGRPAAPRSRSRVHYHDGFFMRFGVAPGIVFESFDVDDFDTPTRQHVEQSDFAIGLQALFGGTPSDGWVFGGGLLTVGKARNAEAGRLEDNYGVGPFVAWYPEPDSGASILCMPALASNVYVLSCGAAAEGWVGQQWSLGGELRYAHVGPFGSDGGGTVIDYRAHALLFGGILTLH